MLRSVLKTVLRVVARVLFRIEVTGLDQHVAGGRLVIVANHESFLDGLLLGLFLPFDPVFVVHTGVIRIRFFRLVLSQVDYVTVDPANPMAMKKIVKLVESGRPIVIFPEGRITVTGSLMKVYEGPAFVAAKTGATVLPVRLDGPARSYFGRLSGRHPRRFLPKITLSVQPPTQIALAANLRARARRHEAAEAMRRVMQKMIFDSQPKQTLYSSLIDAMSLYGRRRRVLEDMQQIEFSYGQLLRMTIAMGRIIARHTKADECIGILLPNTVAAVCALIGASAVGRVPAMLNYKSGTAGMQDACTAAQIGTVLLWPPLGPSSPPLPPEDHAVGAASDADPARRKSACPGAPARGR